MRSLKRQKKDSPIVTSCASACKTNTTQNQPHQITNTQRTENKTTDVVIQQHSRKLLMMDILISETCWAHKKWNKIASDIKLVFHSSTVTRQCDSRLPESFWTSQEPNFYTLVCRQLLYFPRFRISAALSSFLGGRGGGGLYRCWIWVL